MNVKHKGYRAILAYSIWIGSTSQDYVQGQIDLAVKDDAPGSAVYWTAGPSGVRVWRTIDQIENLDVLRGVALRLALMG